MTTPRPHAELAAQFYADNSLKCWQKYQGEHTWELTAKPEWYPHVRYHVGHEPPKVKRTITLTVNGREWVLPEPLKDAPKHDQLVFYISDDGTVRSCRWNNWALLPTLYKERRLHDTKSDAQAWAEFDKWCRGGGV